MSSDRFEATFRVRLERLGVWRRLTENETGPDGDRLWLPGFDSRVTTVESDPPEELRATKDDEPCAGTDIRITLEDDDTGTIVHVVQSRFGDWLPARYDLMAIGWRFIVADLHTYLATGVHARRHLRPWGDLGAQAKATDGGILVDDVHPGSLADDLGIIDGDLLVTLAGAPVASLDDLVTVLRVLGDEPCPGAEWVRDGVLVTGGGSRRTD
jgi:hypothetical protein